MTSRDRSEQIRAAAGRVEVELPETPSTGYRWAIRDLPVGVTLVADVFDSPATFLAGAPGTRRFVFDIPSGGRYELGFELRRPWEGEPMETRTVTALVSGLAEEGDGPPS